MSLRSRARFAVGTAALLLTTGALPVVMLAAAPAAQASEQGHGPHQGDHESGDRSSGNHNGHGDEQSAADREHDHDHGDSANWPTSGASSQPGPKPKRDCPHDTPTATPTSTPTQSPTPPVTPPPAPPAPPAPVTPPPAPPARSSRPHRRPRSSRPHRRPRSSTPHRRPRSSTPHRRPGRPANPQGRYYPPGSAQRIQSCREAQARDRDRRTRRQGGRDSGKACAAGDARRSQPSRVAPHRWRGPSRDRRRRRTADIGRARRDSCRSAPTARDGRLTHRNRVDRPASRDRASRARGIVTGMSVPAAPLIPLEFRTGQSQPTDRAACLSVDLLH